MGIDDGRYAIQLGKILESKNVTEEIRKRFKKNERIKS